MTHKNNKIAENAMEQAKEITIAGAQLNEMCAMIHTLQEETAQLYYPLNTAFQGLRHLKNADYQLLDYEQKMRLGAMVNNTLSLAALVNKKLGEE